MPKKKKSFYEYFEGYNEEEIDAAYKKCTTEEDKVIIFNVFGTSFKVSNPLNEKLRERDRRHIYPIIEKIKKELEKHNEVYIENSEKVCMPVEEKEPYEEQHDEEIQANVNRKAEQNVADDSDISKTTTDRIDLFTSHIEISDREKLVIELTRQKKSNHEICKILRINIQELQEILLNLRNSGYKLLRTYCSNGEILYTNPNLFKEYNEINESIDRRRNMKLKMGENERSITMLAISDLHFGNEGEAIYLINDAFNYCAKKGINVILCGGDFVDGTFSKGIQRISDPYKQMEYFIKNYPYDKSILTFGVGGDHDLSILNATGLDFISLLNNYRHDIVIGGYNNSFLHMHKDSLQLYHHNDYGHILKSSSPLVLHGHNHQFKIDFHNNAININIPSLSKILTPMQTALEMAVNFKNEYMSSVTIRQIYFQNHEGITLNESTFNVSDLKRKYYDSVEQQTFQPQELNTETPDVITEVVSSAEPEEYGDLGQKGQGLSQTAKFQRRWTRGGA